MQFGNLHNTVQRKTVCSDDSIQKAGRTFGQILNILEYPSKVNKTC